MPVLQKEVTLRQYSRGLHLITSEILTALPEIRGVEAGILNVFMKHTSASLTINENADPTVRSDMEKFLNKTVPENEPYFQHTMEGPDDMPAHIKASMMGSSVTIPLTNGSMNLGTWQGIYLCEHRNYGGDRRLVLTLYS